MIVVVVAKEGQPSRDICEFLSPGLISNEPNHILVFTTPTIQESRHSPLITNALIFVYRNKITEFNIGLLYCSYFHLVVTTTTRCFGNGVGFNRIDVTLILAASRPNHSRLAPGLASPPFS
jgi:hypothetical protein